MIGANVTGLRVEGHAALALCMSKFMMISPPGGSLVILLTPPARARVTHGLTGDQYCGGARLCQKCEGTLTKVSATKKNVAIFAQETGKTSVCATGA